MVNGLPIGRLFEDARSCELRCRVRSGCRCGGLRKGRRCGGMSSPSVRSPGDVAASSLEFDTFDTLESTVSSLLVDDLASSSEGDDDGEREIGCCCVWDRGPEDVDPEDERVPLFGTFACIGGELLG